MQGQEIQKARVELEEAVGKDAVYACAPMSRYTTLKLGGPAELLCDIASPEQLLKVLTIANGFGLPITFMGNGSNLLVLDGGIPGVVVRIADRFNRVSSPAIQPDGRIALAVQAGTSLARLAGIAASEGLTGLEFAAGIPGTVGGAVYMNAGAYGGEMQDVVAEVCAYDEQGITHTFTNRQMCFKYRQSRLSVGSPMAVWEVSVALMPGDSRAIRATMRDFATRRREKQPVHLPSCGSTFKRPEGNFVGTLIEQCGLKGYRIGGACVSELHAGFLVNDEHATATEYLQLLRHVQETVRQKTGIFLEPEVRILGA